MKISKHEYTELYDAISKISTAAYKDIFLLSNQVLCKNVLTTNIIERYETGDISGGRFLDILLKLFLYYCKNLAFFFLFLVKYIAIHLFFRNNSVSNVLGKDTIIIDTYFLVNKIDKEGLFSEAYLPGLDAVLKARGKRYVFSSGFYGAKSLFQFLRVFKLLQKKSVPLLSEFQLLLPGDIFRLFYFLIAYPFHLLKFIRKHGEHSFLEKLIFCEMKRTLDNVVLSGYLRYLLGKKIATLFLGATKCISWYENQAIDKNFYRGLRDGKGDVEIIGTQTLVWSRVMLHMYPDEGEAIWGVVPDRVLANGSYYVPVDGSGRFSVGPSLRYKHIFRHKVVEGSTKKGIVVLLPYYDKEICHILKMVKENFFNLPSKNILFKFHPATDSGKYFSLLPKNGIITNKSISEVISLAEVVVGSASGSLLEVAAVGVPVVIIRGTGVVNLNYMSPIGKGIIWDEAKCSEELRVLLDKFLMASEDDRQEIGQASEEIRKHCFCEPTEEKIVEAFGL